MTSAEKLTPRLLVAVSLSALAACGSSRQSAPIVYGANAATPGRIYTAPGQYQPPVATQIYAPPPTAYGQPYGAPYGAPARQLAPITTEVYQAPGTRTSPTGYAPVYQTATYSPTYDPARVQPVSGAGWVTVMPGETVYAISRRTGYGPQAIIAANGLYPPYALHVGQALRLPGAQAAPAAPTSFSSQTYGQPSTRAVRPGETLFSISRATGAPVQAIAAANGLYPPYALQIGQPLVIPGASGGGYAGGYQAPTALNDPNSIDVAGLASAVSYVPPRQPNQSRLFDWPVRGALIANYGAGAGGRRNDGVNIAAPIGTPVRAAADGEVVYRGSELDGYGNLLLVKHADGFVTAYAHNDVMLVRKGQKVQQGQVIAKVGRSGAVSEPQLHFEIRQDLKSVDPLAFLR